MQSIAYGVVLFSLFVQATLIEPLLNKLRIYLHGNITAFQQTLYFARPVGYLT